MARLIYLDEAGTSANEPVTVVAGIIVNADADWTRLEDAIEALRPSVPQHIRSDFVFHATEIFSGGKIVKRDEWDKEERWTLLEKLVSIPRSLNVPIALAYSRRMEPPSGVTPAKSAEYEHVFTFADCILSAADYLQRYAKGEIAAIVAEDCPNMRKTLKRVPAILRRPDAPKEWIGDISISSIKDSIHFCEKEEALLLQLSDACAFSVRLFLSAHEQGERFFRAMMGGVRHLDLGAPAGHAVCVWRDVPFDPAFPQYWRH